MVHSCLLSTDIFYRILDFLEIEPNTDFYAGYHQQLRRCPSIARLARTCKMFLEPCLDTLWRRQLTLGPLVHTLPSDSIDVVVWKHPSLENHPRQYIVTIIRPLLATDWTRFDYYAKRIKALGYLNNEYADHEAILWNDPSIVLREREVSPAIVAKLALYRRGRWLLPNLTHLRWNIYDYHYTDYLPLLLGPRVISLSFAFDPKAVPPDAPYNPDDVVRVIDSLAELCPSVRGLEMYPQYPSRIVAAAIDFAYDCPRLECFHANTTFYAALNPTFVSFLAAQPRLRKVYLTIEAEAAEDLSFLASPPHIHPFSSLQVLTFRVLYIRTCSAFLELLDNCRLFSIQFELEHRPLGEEVSLLFETLRRQCAKYTLHAFILVQDSLCTKCEPTIDPHPTPEYFIGISTLRPALYFPNMRVFMVNLPMSGWLSDEHLREIADAWPGLINFGFLDLWRTGMLSPATWQGVAYMICRCSQLVVLDVTLDTTQSYVTSMSEMPAGLRPNHRFRFLNVIDSVLPEDPYLFALTLLHIAPRLVSIEGTGWNPDPDAPLTHDPYAFCKQVDTILCKLRCEHFGEEYTLDKYGKYEIVDFNTEGAEPLPGNEWSPWV
ncbi:hypothetical protein C8Q73DRAFT_186864 [Cubamyces lactineus]|nr:hypothetical protein C8Q73DRAFT_186864 [Cubamyces lactineus]